MAQVTLNLPTDWKTTLWGVCGGIAIALGQYIQTGSVTWEGCLAAALVVIKGYISADHEVKPAAQTGAGGPQG